MGFSVNEQDCRLLATGICNTNTRSGFHSDPGVIHSGLLIHYQKNR